MKTLTRALATASLLVAVLLPGTATHAGSSNGSVNVTASVSDLCVVNATTLGFGAYAPLGVNAVSPLDVSAGLTIQCIGGTTYAIGLNDGSNFSVSRRLKNGAVFMSYELYKDAAHASRWGDIVLADRNALGSPLATTGSYTLTIYGRIPAAQLPSTGAYSDTITATIYF